MKPELNWGTGLAIAYAAFAAATVAFVVFALGRPVDLVSADYYAQSLRQDQQAEAARHALDLRESATVTQSSGREIVVAIPAVQAAAARGAVTLYRASDAAADRIVDLAPDADGRQRIRLADLRAGQWSVRVRWSATGREFYMERRIVVR